MGGDSRAVEASRDSSGVRFSCTRGSNLKVYPSPDQDGTALGRLVGGVRISKHAGDIPPTGHGAEGGAETGTASEWEWAVSHQINEEPSTPQELVGVNMGFAGSTRGYPLLVLTSKSHGHPESQFLVHKRKIIIIR